MMYEITKNSAQQIIMIHVLSPRRGPLCRSSGCGCDHRDVSYHRNHLADETTDCRWRNYRPGNTPYNSMHVVQNECCIRQSLSITVVLFRVVADRARTQHSIQLCLTFIHLYKIIFCIYKVLLKYVYI